jgi:hypothetical protein
LATIALGLVGGVAGGIIGGPGGARLGFSIGTLVGGLVDQSKQKPQQVGRLSDLQITGSQYGAPIPWIWGTNKLGTQIVWWSDLKETSRKKGSKLTGTRQKVYTYSVDLMGIVCHGPITAILKIWANDTLIYDSVGGLTPANITIKLGDYTQAIITDMDDQQTGPVPAYRGRAGFYVNDFDLTPYGNSVPQFSVLVQNNTAYEDLVRADGPVFYYRFEDAPGLLVDSGNNHLDLTLSANTMTQVASLHGEALSTVGALKAQAQRVGAVVPALLNDQLTAELWFKFDGSVGTAGASEVTYFCKNDIAWRLKVEPNLFVGQTVLSWLLLDVVAKTVTTVHQVSITRDTTEHHLVVVTDCVAGNSKLYVDKVLQDTQTPPLTIGGLDTTSTTINVSVADSYYLDEVAVYDKALTLAQLSEHFDGRAVQVRDVLADIFTECGLAGDQYDVRDATDSVAGFAITDRSEARGVVEGLLAAYFTDLTEYDGRLVAIRRGGASQMTVDALDLGAELVEPGSDPEPAPVIVTRRLQELELPFAVDFAYISLNNGYQQASQRAIRYTKTHLQEQITVSAPLVFTEDVARLIPERMIYAAWVERETFEIKLPLTYLHLTPGDVVLLPVGASLFRCRIVEMTLGLPGAIACRLVLDDAAVLTQVVPGGVTNGPVVFVTPVTNTSFIAWNGNAGRDSDADSIGLYVAANGATAGTWEGAVLFLSRDGGLTYQELTTVADAGTFGTASSVLAAGTSTALFDDTNTVDVLLTAGIDNPPVSRADADLLAGLNGAVIGDEYIQYGVVLSLGGNSYRLSHLIRGKRGTDTFWEEHRTGERVAFDDGGITRVLLPTDIGLADIQLKAVASGQTLADVSAVPARVFARETLEYASVNLAGARSGGNDLSATFIRRARKHGDDDWGDGASLPLDTLSERYQIFPLPAAGTNITAISPAEQAVVTAAGHGLAAGDLAYLTGITGLLPLNGLIVSVVSVAGNDVTIDVDTTQFPAYSGPSGTIRKPTRTISVTSQAFSYLSADATADGLPPAGPVTFVIVALGDDSRRGYSLVGAL